MLAEKQALMVPSVSFESFPWPQNSQGNAPSNLMSLLLPSVKPPSPLEPVSLFFSSLRKRRRRTSLLALSADTGSRYCRSKQKGANMCFVVRRVATRQNVVNLLDHNKNNCDATEAVQHKTKCICNSCKVATASLYIYCNYRSITHPHC